MKSNWRIYQNYIIIAILSAVSVFFLPMLGTSVGLGFLLPNTAAGWTIYIATKLCIVVINILIFDQFIKQAKVNVRDNEFFQEAERILLTEETEEEAILPAKFYLNKMYRTKVLTTGIFTVLGVFGFTNAILTFDWVSMLSYTFTITIGLVFGWISMNQAEEIWTERHYKYAKKVEKERIEQEKHKREMATLEKLAKTQHLQSQDDTAGTIGGSDLLVAPDSPCVDGTNN